VATLTSKLAFGNSSSNLAPTQDIVAIINFVRYFTSADKSVTRRTYPTNNCHIVAH